MSKLIITPARLIEGRIPVTVGRAPSIKGHDAVWHPSKGCLDRIWATSRVLELSTWIRR